MTRAARPVLYLGVFAVVFGLGQVHASFIGHYSFTGSSRFAWTVAYAVILSVTAYGFGLPDAYRTRREALNASVAAAFLGALAISMIQLFAGDALLPRFVVFGAALLLPDWYRICVVMAVGGRSRAEARDRVVAIGKPEDLTQLAVELDRSPERPATIVATYSVAEALEALEAEGAGGPDGFAGSHPTVLVLDRSAQDVPAVVAKAAELHATGVRIRSLSLFYEEWLAKLPISELESASMLFDIGEVHRAGYGRAKRLIDIPLALVGVVAFAVIVPLVWLGNVIGNRGPLLYRQERVGKGDRVFTILKLRTMAPGTGQASDWTAHDDPRVSRFGRVLRATHLDELPQVINILRGDLGVVGPRPEQPHYVELLAEKLPYYRLRHLVRPGLTGWAQVKYGYAGSESDAVEKLQYEFWYLRHQSIRTDARIVGRTVRSVFGGDQGQGR